MAIKLASKANTAAPTTDYPYGNIKDDTTPGTGTPIDVQVYADFHQFFAKLLDASGITPNDLPDNLTNRFQYWDALMALQSTDGLSGFAGDGTIPYIVTGMTFTSTPFPQIKRGWFCYNKQLIQFNTTAIPSPLVGSNVVLVSIANRIATLTQGASVTNATTFPLSILQTFTVALGLLSRDAAFSTIAVSAPGGVTGTISYKKDTLNNCVQIRGVLTSSNAQAFDPTTLYTGSNSPSGPTSYNMGTLATGYWPVTTTPFVAQVRYHHRLFTDDIASGVITDLYGEVDTSGNLNIIWRKPASGISSYAVSFNVKIPLD